MTQLAGRPKHYLKTRAWGNHGAAQIYSYKKIRDIIEAEWGMHFPLGENYRNYAHYVALASGERDIGKKEHEVMNWIALSPDIRISEGQYARSSQLCNEAIETIETGDYLDMNEDQMQKMIGGILEAVPKYETQCCHCRG